MGDAKYYRDELGRLLFVGKSGDGWRVYRQKAHRPPEVWRKSRAASKERVDEQNYLDQVAQAYCYAQVKKLVI